MATANAIWKNSVLVETSDLDAVLDWCAEKIPEDHRPHLTVRTTTNGKYVIRARFDDTHHAALFRLFWDTGR
jgi:hypothetical protein